MGLYLELNIALPYLIVDSEVQHSTQTTKGKEWGGEGLPIGWPHCVANFRNMLFMSIEKGRVQY
jgi:hypothetical protein